MARRKKNEKANMYTKKYTENKQLNNMNPTKKWGLTEVLRKGKQFPLHLWHPSWN